MRSVGCHFLIIAWILVIVTCQSYDYKDYYYDTYDDNAAADENYDLSELVKAWKAYINEKSSDERKQIRTTPAPVYECPPREDSYRTPDPIQCDKFVECNIKGEKKELLCPDGLVFEIKSENCDYPAKVDCGKRTELQKANPSKNCPRANGFFPFPANESCQNFYDCREGKAYLQTCPEGVIFDPKIDACTTPDQSNREECTAGKVLGFECPTYHPEEVLRFGNHDRIPHPTNCQQFFSCLRNGRPRLGACPKRKVFSNSTGHCEDPESVPGCEQYWVERLKDKEDYYYDDY